MRQTVAASFRDRGACVGYRAAMSFHDQLAVLVNKSVTLFIIGSNQEYAGTILELGDDYVTLDSGPDAGPRQSRSMIPLAAISCVATRV
jgi:hypothetical protein